MRIAITLPKNVPSHFQDRTRVFYVDDVAVVLNHSIRPRFTIHSDIDPSRIQSILSQVTISDTTLDTWVRPEDFKVIHRREKAPGERPYLRVWIGEPNRELEKITGQAHWYIDQTTCLNAAVVSDNLDYVENHKALRELKMIDLTEFPTYIKFAIGSILAGNDDIVLDKALLAFVDNEIYDRSYYANN